MVAMQTENASVPEAATIDDASGSSSDSSPVGSLLSLLPVSEALSVSSPPRPIVGLLLVSLALPVVVASAPEVELLGDAVVKLAESSDVVVVVSDPSPDC